MKRLSWILTLPLIIVAVVFSIANREPITLDLWPFDYSLGVPLFVALLASLAFGLLVGGLATWLSAGRTRRRARQARRQADALEREVARLKRERDRAAPPMPAGGPPGAQAAAGPPASIQSPGPVTERSKRSAIGS